MLMKITPFHRHSTPFGQRRKLLRVTAFAALTLGLGQLPLRADQQVGSGKVITETRQVSDFQAVELETFGSVVITQGETEGLTVEGEDNLLPLVTTGVDKGVLSLTMKPTKGSFRATKPLTFKLSVKTLDHLVLTGSGNVNAKDLALQDKGSFDVVLKGSGNIAVGNLAADGLKVTLQGSGSLTVGGNVDHEEVAVAGAGDYDGSALRSKAATVALTGSGDCDVWATDKLKVEVTGSGDVSYYGKPTVDKHVTGTGSVESMGGKGQ